MNKKNNLLELFKEKDPYIFYFNRSLWTLEEFACLINNLSPDQYRKLFESDTKLISKDESKKIKKVLQIQEKFIGDVSEKNILDIQITKGKIILSPWRFIRWAAENRIPIIFNFFQNLPLHLMELYLEFQPNNSILRINRKDSIKYHRAYYLKNAEDLMEKEGREMTPIQLYHHQHMKSTESYIRQLGGNYKKRTFLRSWLPCLIKREKGRPKKFK